MNTLATTLAIPALPSAAISDEVSRGDIDVSVFFRFRMLIGFVVSGESDSVILLFSKNNCRLSSLDDIISIS